MTPGRQAGSAPVSFSAPAGLDKEEKVILVALGANLPADGFDTPRETVVAAADALGGAEDIRVAALSRWYRSAPQPATDQPDFVNGVVRLETVLDPVALLARLHDIERAFGRARRPGARNAARPLDLDLIDYDGIVRAGAPPVLPHPRAHLRRFVLLPLRELAPGWRHPTLGETVDSLLERLPPDDVTLLP